jgi:hypothetical protein
VRARVTHKKVEKFEFGFYLLRIVDQEVLTSWPSMFHPPSECILLNFIAIWDKGQIS